MPTFFQDEINVDIIQHTPRVAPALGRANSPTNGAIWYDSVSNSFQGVVNGVIAAIGGAGSPAFNAITPGTNTGALVIGTGGSLTTSGTGTIVATSGGTPTFPVNAQTTNYTATAADFAAAKLITVTNTNGPAVTITLPAVAPTAGQCIQIESLSPASGFTGAGQVTVARNGLTIDGVAANLVLGGLNGVLIVSDGTNYVTQRGGAGSVSLNPAVSQTVQLAPGVSPGLVINSASSGQSSVLSLTGGGGNVQPVLVVSAGGGPGIQNYLYAGTEIAAPSGIAGQELLYGDSTTHTFTHNPNNNGTMSFSGAWVNTNVTPVTVAASTTADQNLMSVSIPAGTLNRVGRSLRLWCAGFFSTPAAQTEILTFKVKLGALTLINIPIPSQSFTATNNQFNISGMLSVQTGGATAVFESHGNLIIDLGIGNLVADSVFADQNTAVSSTIDITAAQTLQVTVSASVASTSNSFTQRQMVNETVG